MALAEFWWTNVLDQNILIYMESDSYQREEQKVYRLLFHRVWTPKRQKRVLTGNVSAETIQRYIEAQKGL